MLDKLKTNKFIFFNLLIYLFLLVLMVNYNQCLCLFQHEYHFPFHFDLSHIFLPRVLPYICFKFYIDILPKFFHLHPSDFKINIFVTLIMAYIYLLIPILLSKGFYLFNDIKKYFLNKESIFLLPISFFTVSFANLSQYFCYIQDSCIFFDYTFCYIFYFLFFILLFEIIFRNRILTVFSGIFYFIISFILGYWSEFVNLPAFFGLLIILFLSFLFKRKIFYSKSLYIPVIGFLAGIFKYYILSKQFSFNNIGTIGKTNLIDNCFTQFNDFYFEFSRFLYSYKIYWIILLILCITYIAVVFIKKPENKSDKLLFLAFNVGLIVAYLIVQNLSLFIDKNLRNGYIFNLFNMPFNFYLVFIFVFFNLFGKLYYLVSKNTKIFIFSIMCLYASYISYINMPLYINIYKNVYNERIREYNLNKKLIIYSYLNEYCILSLDDFSDIEKASLFPNTKTIIENIEIFHKLNCKGIIISTPEDSLQQLKRREILFKPNFKDEYNIFNRILFTPLFSNNFDNIDWNSNDELLLKYKAQLYLKENKNAEALKLFNQYLIKYPKDVDVICKIAKIHLSNNNFGAALKVYNNYLKNDSENVFILMSVRNIYYKQNRLYDAIKLNNKILSIMNEHLDVYSNIINFFNLQNVLFYKKLGSYNQAKNYYDIFNNNPITPSILNYLDSTYNFKIKDFDEIYYKEDNIPLFDIDDFHYAKL